MNQETFRRELKDLTPDVPEAFHRRVESFLQEKVDQEVNMKESTKRALYRGGRFGSRALIFALAAVLMLGTAAFAATQWGIFDSLSSILGAQPPTADSVMQGKLHQETVNGVEITIREAGYDGKTLFLQYSYRLPDAAEPMGAANRKGERVIGEADLALLAEHNVGWWVDAFWVNGQCMDMAFNSGSTTVGSDVPGEIIQSEFWRLDNIGVELSGKVEIALPIGACPDAEYRKALYDRENDQYTLPDKGVVTFTLDTGDTLSRVVKMNPNTVTVTPEVTVQVTEVSCTPLMTYITLAMEPNADALAAYRAEHGDGERDEHGAWEYSGIHLYGEWVMNLQLVDGSGVPVFPGRIHGCNGYSDVWAEFTYPWMDPEKMPEQLWLAPVDGGAADMEYAIRVK